MTDGCSGCDIPEAQRVNLPEGWTEGDPVPENITRHRGASDWLKPPFSFIGAPIYQNRHYWSPGT